MSIMALAVAVQFVLALTNLAVAFILSRRMRRLAGLERTLQEIRGRLRQGVRPSPSPALPPRAAPSQPQTRLDPTLGFRDPAR